MFNQDEIAAALVMCGHEDPGKQSRGSIALFHRVGPAFFVDMESGWPDDPARTLVSFEIHGREYEVLPIDIPVDSSDIGISFNPDSFRFVLVKPADPRMNPASGQLAASYEWKGQVVRNFIDPSLLSAGKLDNITTRIIGLAPPDYVTAYKKLRKTMTQTGDAMGRMFV